MALAPESLAPGEPAVFVSYASVDRAAVLRVVEALRAAGVRVWIDLDDISGGANYGVAIVEAIKNCAALILMCTPAALASRNVRQEILLAWNHNRPYLPLLLAPTTFPDDVQYWLEGSQWIEVLDHPEGRWLPRVLQALARLGLPGQIPAIAPLVNPVRVAAPLTLDTAQLDLLERALAVHIGPIARVIIRANANAATSLPHLAELVSSEIADVRARAAFVAQFDTQPTGGHGLDDPVPVPVPPRPLGEATLTQGEAALAPFLGPLARVLVKRAAAAAYDQTDLWHRLAEQIDDPAARARFLSSLP